MRIVAGSLKGRTLKGPSGPGLRPTSDGLRETLFNVLSSRVDGARVLDGFAGTGAVGLEAISRGAVRVTFVESDRRALSLIRQNIDHCGVSGSCEVIAADLATLARRRDPPGPFELVFLDPPYDAPGIEAALIAAGRWLSGDGILVLEHSKRRPSPEHAGLLVRRRVLQAGDSALSFYVAGPHADTMVRE
jgi:16S rRNA (guanine(966)-N(2))-methyltransferase RsmD